MPAMKRLGKPDTGNPFVRFDEGRGGRGGTDNCGQFNPPPSTSPTLPLTLMGGNSRRRALPAED